ELHPFFVPLARVMDERDVELGLELGVVLATALCEPEERLVPGVVGERLSEFMVCGEINTEGREAREEVRLIRIEQVRERDARGNVGHRPGHCGARRKRRAWAGLGI